MVKVLIRSKSSLFAKSQKPASREEKGDPVFSQIKGLFKKASSLRVGDSVLVQLKKTYWE